MTDTRNPSPAMFVSPPDVEAGEARVKLSKFINLYGLRDLADETKIGGFVEIQRTPRSGRRCKVFQSHFYL